MKTLVVYFSRKGYVRKIAEEEAKKNNATLLELKTTEHTQGKAGFWWCGRFGMHRWEMPLEEIKEDISSFDKVIICSPIWVFTICAPVRAFINKYKGKINSVDYVLVHFSNPMDYSKTVDEMDKTLGVKHERFTSVVCQLGKIKNIKAY